MQINQWILGMAAAVMLAACGDDDGGGGASDSDRGGPDALDGVSWSMQQSANGIDFKFGFEFGPDSLKAHNTCTGGGQSLTANVEVPVKYRYKASIAEGGKAGTDACLIQVSAGSFDFELEPLTLTSLAAALETSPRTLSLAERTSRPPSFLGPLLVVGLIAVIEVASRFDFKFPNPPAILITICVFSAFTGGVRVGLLSAGMTCEDSRSKLSLGPYRFTGNTTALLNPYCWR